MRSRIPRAGLFGAIFRFFQFLYGFFLLSERKISKKGECVWQICRKNLWLETDFDLIKEQLLCQITCFANSPFSFTDFQALFVNRITTSLKRKRIKTFEKRELVLKMNNISIVSSHVQHFVSFEPAFRDSITRTLTLKSRTLEACPNSILTIYTNCWDEERLAFELVFFFNP